MKTAESEKMMNLPILKHFGDMDLATTGKNALDKFRKGEWTIYQGLKVVAVGGAGYGIWVYALPFVFTALGQMLALATTGIAVLAGIFLAPVAFKGIRRLTRTIHKGIIKHDPFGELENQRNKMLENQNKFRDASAKVISLKSEMESECEVNKKGAEDYRKSMTRNRGKAEAIKEELEQMEKSGGVAVKITEEYGDKTNEMMKALSAASRDAHLMDQSETFVRKYGSRVNVMQKFSQKLKLMDTVMDIKRQDFDTSVELLKREAKVSSKLKQATDTAKEAMLFTKGWELDYALDLIISKIAEDLAITSGNLTDIDTITSKFDLNSDEMFANLDEIANRIKVGDSMLPDASQYSNPNYKLTKEDKAAAGVFGDIF